MTMGSAYLTYHSAALSEIYITCKQASYFTNIAISQDESTTVPLSR
jgi:hypothetical protein